MPLGVGERRYRRSDKGQAVYKAANLRYRLSEQGKETNRERNRKYRETIQGQRMSRRSWLKFSYGLTEEQYDQMLARQGNLCAICRQPSERTLHIDHDHATGRVRGLLCKPCNIGLSNFGDSADRLIRAAGYLQGQ